MTDAIPETIEFRDRSSVERLGFNIQYHICVIDPELTAGALRTYLIYLMHAHQKERCWPLTSTLAEILSVDERTIERHNALLEKLGYITRQRRYGKSSITYIENISKNVRLNEIANSILGKREEKDKIPSNPTKMSPSNPTEMSGGSRQKCRAEEVIIEEEPIKRISYPDTSGVRVAKEEPEYVEPGDEFGDEQETRKWRQPTDSRLLREAFKATGKKFFVSKKERSRWIAIQKAIMPLDKKGKVKYPTQWVENCVHWAKCENRDHRSKTGTRVVKIVFPALLSLIENDDRKTVWLERTLREGKIELSDVSPNVSYFADYDEEEDLGLDVSPFSKEYQKV